MFAGHFAAALAGAALSRRAPPLWVLFVAAVAADILLALLSLAHVEHVGVLPGFTAVSPFDLYDAPWSHSLIGSLGIAAIVGLVVRRLGFGESAAWIATIVAATHWPLDWLVSAPTLSLAGGSVRHGLGLYDRPLAVMPLELTLLAAGIVAYANATRASDRRGRATLAILAIGLAAMQLALWLHPPSIEADPAPANIAWSTAALFVIAGVMAWWCDLTREPTP